MAKKKSPAKKTKLRPLKITDDRPRHLLQRLIKSGRDLNSQDKDVLADLLTELKD